MKISSFSLLWIGNLVLGQFRHIIDDSPEGQPHIFPSEGGQHLFNYGRSLCENRDGMGYYSGVRGMLTDGCCGALYLFVALLADKWKSSLLPPSDLFRYVETGSYQGLSAHIIALSLKNSVGISNAVIYCHDLFDVYIPDKSYSIIEHSGLWDNFMDGAEGRLEKFYSNVRRNNLEKTILPISGPSGKTLKIHPNESVHMVYIDGDHTYQGAMIDLNEGWRILVPGGWMLIHDCNPDPTEPNDPNGPTEILEVRRAVRDFTRLHNLTWNLISNTMYMAGIFKHSS